MSYRDYKFISSIVGIGMKNLKYRVVVGLRKILSRMMVFIVLFVFFYEIENEFFINYFYLY